MNAWVLAGPTQPEAADDESGSTNHGTEQTLLGRREAAPLDDQLRIVLRERDGHVRPDRRANAHADEDEAGLANVEAARADEDDRQSLEDCDHVRICER